MSSFAFLRRLSAATASALLTAGCFVSINDFNPSPDPDASLSSGGAGGADASAGGVSGMGGGGASGMGGGGAGDASVGGASVSADGGDVLDGGSPFDAAPPACEDGTYRCAGSAQQGLLQCEGGEWVSVPGCTGDELCDSSLADTTSDRCAPIAAECISQQPGATFCMGTVLSRCGPDLLTVEPIANCGDARLCAAATSTVCPVCEPGEYQCDGATLQLCGSDQKSWDDVETCATVALCNAGAAACTDALCVPDQYQCTGSVLETCNAAQDGFDTVADCGQDVLCDAVNKQCDICLPGAKQCSGSSSQTCSSDGQSWDSTTCTTCTGQGVCCIAQTETCNGVDDDCDTDVDEDFNVGTPCDGPDTDLCKEGTIVCSGPTATTCTDTTSNNVEVCGGGDEDCDGTSNEEGAANCTSYYVDSDGDTYGTGSAKCLCGPSGSYTATSSGDCCDSDDWAHPGQTFSYSNRTQFMHQTACGTWDYNCDNSVSKFAPDGSGTSANQCADNCNHVKGWDTLYGCPRSCGQSGHWINAWSLCTVTSYLTTQQPCL